MIESPSRYEKFFTVLVFILFSGGLLPVLRSSSGSSSDPEGDQLAQLFFFGAYVGALLFVLPYWKRAVWLGSRDPLIWLITMFAIVSVLWSEAPDLTLRRSIALLGTTVVGVYLATRFPWRQQLYLLSWALGFIAAASLFIALFYPDLGIGSTGWDGAFVTKNAFGRMMVLTALVFMLGGITRIYSRWIAFAGLGLAMFLVIMSSSKTAMVILVVLIIALPVARVLRWHFSIAVPSLVSVTTLGACLVVIVALHAEPLADALGRDTTLTGRTELWSLARTMAWTEPWLGHGYNGFWLGWHGPSDYVWYVVGWEPPHAHLGFLDLWLDLGLIGLGLFLLSFIRSYGRAILWVAISKSSDSFWPLIYLTFLLLTNLTESTILSRNSIFWLLYVSLVLSLGQSRVRSIATLRSPYTQTRNEKALPYGSAHYTLNGAAGIVKCRTPRIHDIGTNS